VVIRVLRHSRGLALFALLVMVGSVPVSISALLHEGADDSCQPGFVVHDESAHRIGASRGSATPDAQHCVVCHWLQSVQTLVAASGAVAAPTECHQLTVSVLPLAGAAALEQIAARAPPAIL
jgi:hypothetical protein